MGYDFNGKSALVIGAAGKRGIGYAVAKRLAQDGADVAVSDVHRAPTPPSEEDRIDGWQGLDSIVACPH